MRDFATAQANTVSGRESRASRSSALSIAPRIKTPPLPFETLVLQRKGACACGGGCPHCRESEALQPKLAVSTPGDQFEQEADRIAEQVMRMPVPGNEAAPAISVGSPALRVQRVCFPPDIVGGPEAEEESERPLQTKLTGQSPSPASVDAHPHVEALQVGGRHLPGAVREFFQPRFGYNFEQVRIHTDERAAQLARSVNARAYTIGRDIVFGSQQYSPDTTDGQRLLAHELTHVVQQGAGVSHSAPGSAAGKEEGQSQSGAINISRMESGSQASLQRKLCLGGSSAAGLVSMLNDCAGLGGMQMTDETCGDACPSDFRNVELFQGPPTADLLTRTLWDVLTSASTTACWRGVSNAASVFIDQFTTRSMDIGDIGHLPATPPSSFPAATTRCEAFAHNVAEFWHADRTGDAFPASHPIGLAAQGTFRSERGQPGPSISSQTLAGAGHGVTTYSNGAKTHTFFSGGNITSVTHEN